MGLFTIKFPLETIGQESLLDSDQTYYLLFKYKQEFDNNDPSIYLNIAKLNGFQLELLSSNLPKAKTIISVIGNKFLTSDSNEFKFTGLHLLEYLYVLELKPTRQLDAEFKDVYGDSFKQVLKDIIKNVYE